MTAEILGLKGTLGWSSGGEWTPGPLDHINPEAMTDPEKPTSLLRNPIRDMNTSEMVIKPGCGVHSGKRVQVLMDEPGWNPLEDRLDDAWVAVVLPDCRIGAIEKSKLFLPVTECVATMPENRSKP